MVKKHFLLLEVSPRLFVSGQKIETNYQFSWNLRKISE